MNTLIPIDKAHGLLSVFMCAGVPLSELAKATNISEFTLRVIQKKTQGSVQTTTYNALLDELIRRREADPEFRAALERIKQGQPEEPAPEENEQDEVEPSDDIDKDEDSSPEDEAHAADNTASEDDECDDELVATSGDNIDLSTTFNRTEILILAKSFKHWSDSIVERLNNAARETL